MKRWLVFIAGLITLTVALYALLYWFSLRRIDWVIFVASPSEPQFKQHGRPEFSPDGFAWWVFALSAYAAGVICFARRSAAGISGRLGPLSAGVVLFCASLGLVAVVHPTFLAAFGTPELLGVLGRFPRLRDIYEHWGFMRQLWWIFLVQLLLAVGAGALVRRRA